MDLYLLVSDIKFGKTFTIECKIKNVISSESESLHLLFDTGASHTAICEKVLVERGYTAFTEGTSYRQTANGKVKLQRCIVQDFRLVGFQPENKFTVDVVKADFAGFQGLLGMDYIYKLEIWISRSRAQAHIFGGFPKFANFVMDLKKYITHKLNCPYQCRCN